MKITMYELLGMVKDGKAPKKIKIDNTIYEYHDKEHGYCRHYHDNTYICLDMDYRLFNILNNEVEIIEEKPTQEEILEALRRTAIKNTEIDYENGRYVTRFGNDFQKDLNEEINRLNTNKKEKKIPEKLKDILRVDDLIPPVDENMYKIWTQTIKNQNKINEIIDCLKSKGDK